MNIIDQEIKNLFYQATYANSNKKPFKLNKHPIKTLLLFLTFIFGFFICLSVTLYPSVSAFIQTIEEPGENYISPVEKITYKNIVKQVAIKEKRHPNSIHSELRKAFNYRSYLQLTKEQYDEIVSHLETRI